MRRSSIPALETQMPGHKCPAKLYGSGGVICPVPTVRTRVRLKSQPKPAGERHAQRFVGGHCQNLYWAKVLVELPSAC